MDSTAVQAIADNTAATMALNGTLWVFMGFIAFMVAGTIIVKYTFKGY